MAGSVHGQQRRAAALITPLQWLAIGSLLGNVIFLEVGRWSLRTVGLVVLAWAAHTARTACHTAPARALWACLSVAFVMLAVASAVVVSDWPTVIAMDVVQVIVANVVVWAMWATAAEFRLDVARGWRALAMALAAATALGVAAATVVWNVGQPRVRNAGGVFIKSGVAEFTVPGWAWLVLFPVGLIGLGVGSWTVVLFVRTYRLANAGARSQESELAHGSGRQSGDTEFS